MMLIYSKHESNKLLHGVYRLKDTKKGRQDLIPEDQFLQLAVMRDDPRHFTPHYHIYKECPHQNIAQESWVVLQGKVKVDFYDIDGQLLQSEVLNKGDVSFSIFGGHGYEILEKDTIVYEFKSGPYEGQAKDKRFYDED